MLLEYLIDAILAPLVVVAPNFVPEVVVATVPAKAYALSRVDVCFSCPMFNDVALNFIGYYIGDATVYLIEIKI